MRSRRDLVETTVVMARRPSPRSTAGARRPRPAYAVWKNSKGRSPYAVVRSEPRRMNRPQVAYFLSGVLVHFPTSASTGAPGRGWNTRAPRSKRMSMSAILPSITSTNSLAYWPAPCSFFSPTVAQSTVRSRNCCPVTNQSDSTAQKCRALRIPDQRPIQRRSVLRRRGVAVDLGRPHRPIPPGLRP